MAMMASAASDPFNSFDDDNDLLDTDPLDGGENQSITEEPHQV
jgi:hypothetical protein